MKKILIAAVCLSMLAAFGCSDNKPVELKYNLKKGRTYKSIVNINATIKAKNAAKGVDINVEGNLMIDTDNIVTEKADTTYTIDMVIDRAEMGMNLPMLGMKLHYGSGKSDHVSSIIAKFTGKPITMVMTERGGVVKLSGMGKLFASVLESFEGKVDSATIAEARTSLDSLMQNQDLGMAEKSGSIIFPGYPVSKGDKWENNFGIDSVMRINTLYEYKGTKDGCYHLGYNMDVALGEKFDRLDSLKNRTDVSVSIHGDMLLDKSSCWTRSAEIIYDIKIAEKEPKEGETYISVEMRATISDGR